MTRWVTWVPGSSRLSFEFRDFGLFQVIVLQLYVMPGRVFEPGLFLFGERAHLFRRAAEPEVAAFEILALGDEAAGAEENTFTQNRAVQKSRAHADQAARLDGAAVDDALMADGDVVADEDRMAAGGAFVRVGDVDHGAVLDVGAAADADDVHVPAHRAHGPDRGVRADLDIADHGGLHVDVGARGDLRQYVFVRSNGHDDILKNRQD